MIPLHGPHEYRILSSVKGIEPTTSYSLVERNKYYTEVFYRTDNIPIRFFILENLLIKNDVGLIFATSDRTLGPPNRNWYLASYAEELKGSTGVVLATLPYTRLGIKEATIRVT